MEQNNEVKEQSADQAVNMKDAPVMVPSSEGRPGKILSQQAGGCPTCGGVVGSNNAGTASFVYALGRIEARCPNLACEKEFAQATGRADAAGLTDREALHKVLSQRQNRYLVRQLCWCLLLRGWRPTSWCRATLWTMICWSKQSALLPVLQTLM